MGKNGVTRHATAQIVEPITGDKLYQERARRALPLLVRQAEAEQPIFYSNLADELGMSNARNLNYPLGSIGQTLQRLGKARKIPIPPLQALVINKNTGFPGEGLDGFLKEWGPNVKLTKSNRDKLVQRAHAEIYAFPNWRQVLRELALEPCTVDYSKQVKAAARFGGGESEEHLHFKQLIAENPNLIGLPATTPKGDIERKLPSGDCLDVSFETPRRWIAVEVKSAISAEADITRGLFQCVKYLAVMDAVVKAESRSCEVRACLVLEGAFPVKLVPLRGILGVEVQDRVRS